jgi:hypothetical protein
VLSILELADVLANGRPADARVTLDVHVVAQGEYNRLDLGREFAGGREDERLGLADGDVDRLQNTDRIGRGFSCTGLSLRNDISALCYGQNSALLDGRGFFKV